VLGQGDGAVLLLAGLLVLVDVDADDAPAAGQDLVPPG
jgi:hypothetical protein